MTFDYFYTASEISDENIYDHSWVWNHILRCSSIQRYMAEDELYDLDKISNSLRSQTESDLKTHQESMTWLNEDGPLSPRMIS